MLRIAFGSSLSPWRRPFVVSFVARRLRILQGFAGICRWILLICFVFNRGVRFPKPKVACSTHAGATIVFNHFKGLVALLFGLLLRGGCRLFLRFRAVQPINPADIRTRHEMPIQIDGDLDGAVSELISHIGQARSRLNQQGRGDLTDAEPRAHRVGNDVGFANRERSLRTVASVRYNVTICGLH